MTRRVPPAPASALRDYKCGVQSREVTTVDQYKRLTRAFTRKKAEQNEILQMLKVAPISHADVPNPVRVKLQEKLLWLNEEVQKLDIELLGLHSRVNTWEVTERPTEQPQASVANTIAIIASKKIANPRKHPFLTLAEAREILGGKSRSTIYRWLEEGKLTRANLGRKPGKRAAVLILTASILKLLEEDPE